MKWRGWKSMLLVFWKKHSVSVPSYKAVAFEISLTVYSRWEIFSVLNYIVVYIFLCSSEMNVFKVLIHIHQYVTNSWRVPSSSGMLTKVSQTNIFITSLSVAMLSCKFSSFKLNPLYAFLNHPVLPFYRTYPMNT